MQANPGVTLQVETSVPRVGKSAPGRVDMIIEHESHPTRFVVELKRIRGSPPSPAKIDAVLDTALTQATEYDVSTLPTSGDHITSDVYLAAVLDDDNAVHVRLSPSSTTPPPTST